MSRDKRKSVMYSLELLDKAVRIHSPVGNK